MDYKFEQIQPMLFQIYDVDNGTSSLADDDYLGGLEVKLSEIVSSPNSTLTRPLKQKNGTQSGTITIRCEQRSGSRDTVAIQFEGKSLPK